MAHADINSTDKRKAWRARNPEKDQAHRAVENFVRKLRRQGISLPDCQSCGKSESEVNAEGKKIHAHHTDYSRPLDVVWLCDSCHIISHWNNSWRAERAGKKVRVLQTITVVGEK